MEIIAFERGIRCNPPPSPSFPFESRPRPTEVRDPDLFSIGFNTAIHRNAHGFPPSLRREGGVVKSRRWNTCSWRERDSLLLPTNVGQFSSDNIDLPSILDEEEGEGEGPQKFLRISRGAEEETEQCRYRTSG